MLKKIQTIFQQEGLTAVPRRAWAKLLRESGVLYEEAIARRKGSYIFRADSNVIQLTPRLGMTALESLTVEECIPQEVGQYYLEHRFDLLGSGWVQVRYGMQCRGMAGYRYDMGEAVVPDSQGDWLASRLNPSNLEIAGRIWQRVDPDYQAIDWQLDFKSGYRWSEKSWVTRLSYGHLLGVDVKVPWELSRMQHLPQMALRVAALGVKDAEKQQLVREIRNQWLDFIATNPPGFGVNWLCPMDIAIRGANWCLAWDILHAAGFALDPKDESVLAHSLLDHGRYIVRHLEWSSERANHYLANICGLAFIAAYLPETRETDLWLAFAIGQLQVETLRQFLPDGGNFEGSTAYHRLSAEMVLYAAALFLGLPRARLERLAAIDPKEYAYVPRRAVLPARWTMRGTGINAAGECVRTPFELRFVERLQRAVSFFAAILKPLDGSFPQIGDNDSGRFFKLHPVYRVMIVGEAKQRYLNLEGYDELDDTQPYYFEEHCQGLHLLNAASGLGLSSLLAPIIADSESGLISGLASEFKFTSQELPYFSVSEGRHGSIAELTRQIKSHPNGQARTFRRPEQETSDHNPLYYLNFPDFGLHVWRSKGLMITLRSIESDIIHAKGHFHDDQLSVGLTIDGSTDIRDPGTYVYTALPAERNRYRSREGHFPASFRRLATLGVFEPPYLAPVQRLYAGIDGFAGLYATAEGAEHLVLRISEKAVEIFALERTKDKSLASLMSMNINFEPYSPGYGIKERT